MGLVGARNVGARNVGARNARKEDNRGRMQPITKVTMKMHHPVREDLLRYLQSNITT